MDRWTRSRGLARILLVLLLVLVIVRAIGRRARRAGRLGERTVERAKGCRDEAVSVCFKRGRGVARTGRRDLRTGVGDVKMTSVCGMCRDVRCRVVGNERIGLFGKGGGRRRRAWRCRSSTVRRGCTGRRSERA